MEKFIVSQSIDDFREYLLQHLLPQRQEVITVNNASICSYERYLVWNKNSRLWVPIKSSLLTSIVKSDLGDDFTPTSRMNKFFMEIINQFPTVKSKLPAPELWSVNSHVINLLTGEIRDRTSDDLFRSKISLDLEVSVEKINEVKGYFRQVIENADEFLDDLRLFLAGTKSISVQGLGSEDAYHFEHMLNSTKLVYFNENVSHHNHCDSTLLQPGGYGWMSFYPKNKLFVRGHAMYPSSPRNDEYNRWIREPVDVTYLLTGNKLFSDKEIREECSRILPVILFVSETRFLKTKKAH